MRATLVHNPDAGDERHTGDQLRAQLKDAGYDIRVVSGKRGVARRLEDPGELVVVAGGDGSVRRVALALAGRRVPMAILPLGTANNIAKSMGAIGSVAKLIGGWRDGVSRALRVGRVETADGTMRFVESAGIGPFAELVTRGELEVEENAAGLTGHEIDRALQLLGHILAERPSGFRRLMLDGEDLSGDYLVVEALNIPLIGPNIPLARGADAGDDRLDLVTITDRERGVLLEYVRGRLAGEAVPLELPVRRGARIELQARPGELHVDDGPWKRERTDTLTLRAGPIDVGATITLDHQVVEVLVPAGVASRP